MKERKIGYDIWYELFLGAFSELQLSHLCLRLLTPSLS